MDAGATEPSDDRPAAQPSLHDLAAQLIDDGREWLQAEAAVLKAEARRRLIIAGIGLGLLVLAATLTAGTLIALLVGAMFALTPVIGSGWAIASVVATALLLAAVFALMGRTQLRRLTRGRKTHEGNAGTDAGNGAA